MQNLLTPEDSKRVADAMIEKIEEADFNIADAVLYAVNSILMPKTKNYWKEDWFPLCIEEMCDQITTGVIGAAYEAAEKKRADALLYCVECKWEGETREQTAARYIKEREHSYREACAEQYEPSFHGAATDAV